MEHLSTVRNVYRRLELRQLGRKLLGSEVYDVWSVVGALEQAVFMPASNCSMGMYQLRVREPHVHNALYVNAIIVRNKPFDPNFDPVAPREISKRKISQILFNR